MKKIIQNSLVLFLLLVVLLSIFRSPEVNAASPGYDEKIDPVDNPSQEEDPDLFGEVQEQIEAVGAYGFTAEIEQTIIPRPVAANIGKTEERVDLQVAGQVTLPDQAALTLRFEAGVGLPPIMMEQEGTTTYLLKDGKRTEIENPLGAALPTADFLGYLQAAEQLQLKNDPTQPQYTIYEFEINGRRYANYVRDVMQRSLPPEKQGTRLLPSPILQQMTGRGELWVDQAGYPQRQILDIHIPEVNDYYNSQSHMVVDFHFQTPLTGVPLLTSDNVMALGNLDDDTGSGATLTENPERQPAPTQETAASPTLPLQTILLQVITLASVVAFTILIVRRPRQVRLVLPIFLVAIFIASPLLQGEAYAQKQERERKETVTLNEALGLTQQAEERDTQQTPTNIELQAAAGDCGSGSNTDDSDLDGTNDFVENCLGTDAYYFDTDHDQITDTLEIQGFTYNSQTWYSDPNNVDTNEDGLADYFEWPEPVGTADSWDPDGDGIPNLWDSDNDGDGIPDDIDMNPFEVTDYNASFSLQTTAGDSAFDGYQYIEIQIQPQDEDHLRYTTTSLDWPYDEEGVIQDLDSSADDVTLTPILKVTTTNPPSSDLQEDYGLSAFSVGSGQYELYVILSPLSDGGQITAFEGKVVYGPDELSNIAWSKMELIWMAYMQQDEQNGNKIDTETTPIVEYAESAFRITGLDIAKSGDTDFAVFGTPNSPNDDRDLYQLLFGLEASFLAAVNPGLDEIVSRFSSGTATITETWGVPASDVVVATPSAPPAHYDEIPTSSAELLTSFLDDNGYPTTSDPSNMASLAVAVETELGTASLDDLDSVSGSSFTFSLANIPVNTIRSLAVAEYQYNGSKWDSMDTEDVLGVLYERYSDLSTILADLQLTYPDLTVGDLYSILINYALIWSTSGQSQMIASDGIVLVDETASDEAITAQYELDSANDLFTYLIEANDLAIEGAGSVVADRTTYLNYVRSQLLDVGWRITIDAVSGYFSFYYLTLALKYSDKTVFLAHATVYGDKALKFGTKLVGVSSVDDIAFSADDLARLSLRSRVGLSMIKYASKIGLLMKALGAIVSAGLLAFELYSIWSARANYNSPYDYDEEYATTYAIVATVIAVIFFLMAFTVVGLVILIAIAIASIIVAALSAAFGQEFDFVTELIGAIASLISSYDPYTQVLTFDFDGLKIDSDGIPVVGSSMKLSDKFTGYIERVEGSDDSQLEQSDIYAWFQADAESSDITVSTSRGDSNCSIGYYIDYEARIYYGNTKGCKNKLSAEFTFGSAGINLTLELLYKIKADTRYEECGFLGISCSKKTDYMTLPDELDDDDAWDWVEITMDVLPNTVDGLVGWSALSNNDSDGDDLTTSEENSLGTSSNSWDTDGDGLSDGFESGVQAEAGTNPLDSDSDDDGLNDGLEYQIGATINDADSDDDGLSDSDEFFHWTGTEWAGGGWFVNVDGADYWVFSSSLNSDADNDGLNDASEKNLGSSPYAANEAPTVDIAAGPYLFNEGVWSVVVANGQTVTASVDLLNSGPSDVDGIFSLCIPAVLTGVTLNVTGDRVPATQLNGSCYEWDFSGNNLLFLQEFHVDMTAIATGSTTSGEIAASVPYLVDGNLDTISVAVPFIQDNTPPAVQLTSPISGTNLNTAYYVIGGYSQDADSWVDHVEVTVPAGTFTATGASPWAYTWELPADGILTLSAVAYDVVGNASVLDSVQVTVDTQPPAITSNLPDGATISSGESLSTTFALSGTVTDNFSGLVRVQLRYNEQPWRTIWSDDSHPLNTTWSGDWELPAVQTAQGEHHLYLRAYDAFDNIGYFTQTVFVDVIPPTNELTNRVYTNEDPPHVPAGEPLTLYGVVNDTGNNPLPADPAALEGDLHSIGDATVWLQPDTLEDNDEGVTVAWIGDFNGDRLGDLAVGLPAAANGAGEVVVVRGAAGDWPIPNIGELEFLAEHRPSFVGLPDAGLGTAVQPAGDFNGDGFNDMLVGDPANNRIFLVFGTSLDFSVDRELDGSGGTRWAEIVSLTAGETISASFALAGDVNNDSLSDILVSTTSAAGGKVYLLLGDVTYQDPQALDFLAGAVLETNVDGASVGAVGDVNGDFIDDFAIGMGGVVYLFAGGGGWIQAGRSALTTGMAMGAFASSDSQPTIVAAGDVNNDGLDDFAFTSGSSPVVVFGDASQSFSAQTLGGGFPYALSGFLVSAGDVDKDDHSDLLIGNSNGDAYLLLGSDLTSVAATIEGVETAASAPYTTGADLAGDGSSDLLIVPSASAAADMGYDTLVETQRPFVSGAWLPTGDGGTGSSGHALVAPSLQLVGGGDVTVGKSGADFTTIQAAINSGADRVLIEPGVYKETITVTSDVIIAGSGADLTWIQFPDGATPTVLVDVDGASNVSLMNVSLVGDGGIGLQATNGANNVTLARTVIRDMDTAVLVDGSTADLELKNNTIIGNVDGFNATNCASVNIRSAIFAYNTGTALQYEACAALQLHQYNLYFANGIDMSPLDPGGGELFSAPLFLDYGSNDFRVADESPVIDAGSPGDSVPPGAGNAPDIGHMEQTGSSFFADDDYCSTCDNDGLIWGVDAFDTIQAAVDAAQSDLYVLSSDTPVQFTVGVGSGVFTESVVISSSIQLLGSDADQTTIQGNGAPAVTFQAAVNAGVSGFTLIGDGPGSVGVLIQNGSNTVSISYNLIKNNDIGISVVGRSSGSARFNTIVANTVGVETSRAAAVDTQYNWFDLDSNIISDNGSGLVANGLSVIFSEYNLLYNTIDYTAVLSGLNDLTGQDPSLTTDNYYLQAGSPALDAASPLADIPTGGGVRADIGWHELLSAPVSVFMGQSDDSIATESIGVAQVEYAIVAISVVTSPITSTLPTTWTVAALDNPGEKLSYWQTTYTPTAEGLYRIYSRATDELGNTEMDSDDWYDGAFVVDGATPVITLTLTEHWEPYMQLVEAQVYDYAAGTFDIEEIYFEIDGERVEGVWSLQEWEEDGVSPRTFHYFFRNPSNSPVTYSFQAFAVDGAGHLGSSTLQNKLLQGNVLGDNDFEAPRFLSLDVSDTGSNTPPFDELVTGTVTFEGTAGDFSGGGGLVPSWIDGYEISFDSGASWDIMESWDRDGVPNGNFTYDWEVAKGLDATTIPVRIRATDNVGLSRMVVLTITLDTAAPQRFEPITFSSPYDYHFDQSVDLTTYWRLPLDGSGTAQPVVMYGTTDGVGVPWFEVNGAQYTTDVSEVGAWYAHIGAEDDAGNIAYEVFGPWYPGSNLDMDGPWTGALQSMSETMDGVLDIDHNEWLTDTELLDTDNRPDTPQSLWAAWDGFFVYLGWQGGWWGNDGTLWAYYDLLTGGTDQPVTGTVSLPFDADFAVSVEDADSAYLWTYDGSNWTAELFSDLSWPQVGVFGHNEEVGQTEFVASLRNCCTSTDTFDSHRLMAFTLDDSGDVWSAFPTTNPLNGSFDYYYEWPIINDSWDLLNQPVSAQEPYAALSLDGMPTSADTLSTDETVQYIVTVTNLEDEETEGLKLRLTGSSGLTYQSVDGAACDDCSAGDNWLLDIPTITGNSTHVVTVTAQLASDLTGITQVTTTGQLTTTLAVGSPETIAHTIDTDAPTVTINANPGNALGIGSQTVKGTADDGLGAGVAFVEVSPDGSTWQLASGAQSWTAVLTVPSGSTYQLYARATDYHSQTGPVVMVTFNVDTAAPLLNPVVPALVGGAPVGLFSGTTQDQGPTGARVKSVAMQVDSGSASWQNGAVYAADGSGLQNWLVGWTLPGEDGVAHTVRFRATDYAGNVTISTWYNTTVDTIAPAITVTQYNPVVEESSATLALAGTVTDGTAVAQMTVLVYPETGSAIPITIPVTDSQWSYDPTLPIGQYKLLAQAIDTAGNSRNIGFYSLEVVEDSGSTLDIVVADFTADGRDTVTVTYQISGTAVPTFSLGFYRSTDSAYEATDALLSAVAINDPADRSAGSHTVTFTLGVNIALVNGAAENNEDYYLLAVADADDALTESDSDPYNEDNTTAFRGLYHQVGHPAFVHGSEAADIITADGASIFGLTVTFNGVSTTYNTATDLRIRAHGGSDTVNIAAITFIHMGFAPFLAGGDGADTLMGGSADDVLLGGDGNDILDGGGSADTASYADSPSGVVVDLMAGTAADGYGGTDTLSNISNAIGSAFPDSLTGNTAANIFYGGAGDDSLDGDRGKDTLIGEAGNDLLDGGLGADTADYANSPAAVTADLNSGAASDGFGTADAIANIENLTGSDYNDTLTGNNGRNLLKGGFGDDILIGGLALDTLQGQAGDDTLYGNTAVACSDGSADKFAGGFNTDTAYYNASDGDVIGADVEVQNTCP